jgi:hypothetical protein
MLYPGSQVLSENGYDFLVVNGQCHFWVQTKAFGDVRTGTLEFSQSAKLSEALKLDTWSGLEGTYQSSLCDGPWMLYRFAAHRMSVQPYCNGPNTAERIAWLREQTRSEIERLHAQGTPVDGPVRYVLVIDEGMFPAGSDAYRNAPLWPLATPAASLAITVMEANHYSAGESHLVPAGPDAQSLRSIAADFRAGSIGREYYLFIPIRDAEGRYYQFFVRDSIPIENEQGLWRAE